MGWYAYLIVAFPGHTHLPFTKVLTDLFSTSLLHCTVRAIFLNIRFRCIKYMLHQWRI